MLCCLHAVQLTQAHFLRALHRVTPSFRKTSLTLHPAEAHCGSTSGAMVGGSGYESIGGLLDVKTQLIEVCSIYI